MPRGKRVTARDCRVFLERIAAGDTFAQAAEAVGTKPGAFYSRTTKGNAVYDPVFAEALGDALQERALLKADVVDEKFDAWIQSDECAPALRLAWAKRWHPAYREKQQVEVTGAGGGAVEVAVEHDYGRLVDKLERYRLLPRGSAAAFEAETVDAGDRGLLPSRAD